MNRQEAQTAWEAHRARFELAGATLPGVRSYVPDEIRHDFVLAMDTLESMGAISADALPTLMTNPNAGIPALLTTMIDPQVFEVLFAPNKAAEIFGEVRKGTWLDQTVLFPTVEHDGEVTSYGDYAELGHTGVNTNWPQRQSYLYQTVKEYGELELARAGLGKVNWVAEIDKAAATVLNKFQNLTYFFGVANLQNYGLLNDPALSASLTPASKAWGGTKWILGSVVEATANEVYADIQSLFLQLVANTGGLVQSDTKLTLALSPQSEVALTATNTFNVNVHDLLKKNFPNISIKTAVQYGVITTQNSQGLSANLVQLFAEDLEGQQTGYCAFNEKLRSHPIIRAMSSYKQKLTAGTWGAIIRMPVAIVSMLGV
jgi:hypothetical protein